MLFRLLLLVVTTFIGVANAGEICGGPHVLPAPGVSSQQPVYAESYVETTKRETPAAFDQDVFKEPNCEAIYQAPRPGEWLWLKFSVSNRQEKEHTGYIDFGEFSFDEVVLFEEQDNGTYQQKINGRVVARTDRATQTLRTKIPFVVAAFDTTTFYLRINGMFAPTVTPFILTQDLFYTTSSAEQLISSVFIGYLFALLIISLILFRRVEVRFFQYYATYIMSLLVAEIIWAGWLGLLTDTQIPVSGMNRIYEALTGAGALSLILFARVILDVKRQRKGVHRALYMLIGITAVGVIFAIINPWVFSPILQIIYAGGALVVFICCAIRYRDGLAQAKPLCASFLFLFLGVGIATWFYLSPLSIVEATSVLDILIKRPQEWGYYVGVLGQTVFMAFAITTMVRSHYDAELARTAEAPELELAQVREEFTTQLRQSELRIAALEQSLVDHYPDADLSPADARFITWANEQVSARIGDINFGVKELASALGTSEKTLGRRLKRAVNQSPVVFIRMRRLTHARDLFLLNQHNTVAEVAYAAGFSNLSHFARHYREAFGIPPKDALRAETADTD